jgi:hypothetical protein
MVQGPVWRGRARCDRAAAANSPHRPHMWGPADPVRFGCRGMRHRRNLNLVFATLRSEALAVVPCLHVSTKC